MIRINGEKPDLYSSQRFENFTEEIFVNKYTLVTGDSFEIGEAYSLHPDLESAKRFISNSWWRKRSGPLVAYVTALTLEKMVQSDSKVIFRSWEN
jgi:hypothetical protein